MALEKRANWLDQAIAETAPGGPPKADFAAWREDHPEALAALARRAQRKTTQAAGLPAVIEFGRRIMRSPITKLAAAAVLIIGIFVLADHLTGRGGPRRKTEPQRAEAILRRDLALAHALYVRENVDGLLSLLESGTDEVKMKAAEYLGEIGDDSALTALQPFASQWQGAPDANPFQKAVDRIKGLGEPPEQPSILPTDETEPNAVSETPAKDTPSEATIERAQQRLDKQVTNAGPEPYEGLVIDEAGHAVPGVRVWGQTLSTTLECVPFAEETTTDGEGRFRLARAAAANGEKVLRFLYFDHPEYGIGWHSIAGPSQGTEAIEVTLHGPASVGGLVVDHLGQPVANALVEAEAHLSVNGREDHLILWDATGMAVRTDDAGRFALRRLPAPAALRLRISAARYALHTSPSDPPHGRFPVQAGTDDLRIVLEPGGGIAGHIVYADGTPYRKQAAIIVEGDNVSEAVFASGAGGRFVSPGLPAGSYRVSVLGDGSKPLCRPVSAQVDLGDEAEIVLTVLDEGLPVTVRTVDATTAAPLQRVWVRAEFAGGGEGYVASARTGETGQCVLSVPPGEYRIVAQGWKNGQIASFSEALTIVPKQTDAAVLLTMTARPVIAGQLIDVHGHPMEGFVQIDSGTRTRTDPNGRFVAEEPFGGTFEYKPSWAYDATGQLAKMFLFREADLEGELAIVLEPCVILTGRIVTGGGSVKDDVSPRLGICRPGGGTSYHSRVPWEISTSDHGIFVIDRVPVGVPVRVSAEWKGMQGGVEVETLVPGRPYDVGDIVLRGVGGIDENTDWTGTLEGRITDEENRPVKEVRVRAYTGIDHFEAKTDRKGRYKLTGLPKGVKLNFNVYVPGYGHNHRYVYAGSDDGDAQIFPQGWELLGKPAPALSIARWFNSPPLTLEDLRGKVVVIQVGVLLPLYGEHLTTMQRLHEKYGEKGLELIAVHQPLDVTWGGKVTVKDIEQFVDQGKAPFAFCLDQGRETYKAYAPKATPALYLIDREGLVVVSPTIENVDKCIEELLAQ